MRFIATDGVAWSVCVSVCRRVMFVRPRPRQQQCRSNVRLCCQKRQQCRTSFALKFRPFDRVERCFDIVAGVDRALALQKRLNRSRCATECQLSWAHGTMYQMGLRFWDGKGQFWELKNIGSLCCGVRSKRDHSVVNNGMTCDVAFCQNYPTACYHFISRIYYNAHYATSSILICVTGH